MQIEQILKIAEKFSDMNASAAVCLQDAKHLAERGLNEYAKKRALASLGHSVGIFHSDYQAVKKEIQ